MSCDYLRENLFEYLDDSLLPPDQAAVEKHLAECPQCRAAVQRESKLGRAISSGMEQAVRAVTLDGVDRRRMARAVERELGGFREQPLVLFWKRVAWSLVAAAILLVAGIWMRLHFMPGKDLPRETVSHSTHAGTQEIFVSVSYPVPRYTFRTEGNRVVDALTFETVVAEQGLAVKNEKPRAGETYYEN
jgi:predicted anti-sigma-YlaC factor YlaD